MTSLTGRTALVTGGTSGIGLATAQRFAAEGADVFITGRRGPELDRAVAAIEAHVTGTDPGAAARPRVTGIQGDVSSLDDLERVFSEISVRGRGLDVLFANAGGGEFATLETTTPEHFDQTFGINVRGTVFTVQKALPLLNRGASVILAGSTSATSGTPAFGTYAATKAAIRSFARTWAAELAPRDIRVNVIVPGPTETEGLKALVEPEQEQALLKELAANTVLGRVGRPEEVAAAVLFLASDQSSFMTGSELFADGGEEQR